MVATGSLIVLNTHQRVDIGRARQSVAARRAVLAAVRPHCRQEPGAERQQPGAESQESRHGLQGQRNANSEPARAQRGPSEGPSVGQSELGVCGAGARVRARAATDAPSWAPALPADAVSRGPGTGQIASQFPGWRPEPGAAPGTGLSFWTSAALAGFWREQLRPNAQKREPRETRH